MTKQRYLVSLFVILFGVALAAPAAVDAQEEAEYSFDVTILAALCDEGDFGPDLQGCAPWEGAEITIEGEGIAETCVTEATADNLATCPVIAVPGGATILVTLNEANVPEGRVLQGENPQSFTAPTEPPDGIVPPPTFLAIAPAGETPPPDDGEAAPPDDGEEAPPADGEAAPPADDGAVVAELPATGTGTVGATNAAGTSAMLLGISVVLAMTAGMVRLGTVRQVR